MNESPSFVKLNKIHNLKSEDFTVVLPVENEIRYISPIGKQLN